ncbi:MAG: hypothetical protein QN122_05070 [Armatimonadota bacterium]|nr:hypothetical protein [Armatimonadota bacterium]MDR7448791.1 hypothetical protein [Armatimonadota bacterium]MDR7479637.1 hypothetical protein [Armatimonadota bacterium]MDR7489443.1 hypothetical protein [Armatimonadota bacterium]MDR7490806.1 hypothetical protein [Armatimonadota bacterium]
MILLEGGGRAYVPATHLPAGAGVGTVLRLHWEVEGVADAAEVAARIEALRREEHW